MDNERPNRRSYRENSIDGGSSSADNQAKSSSRSPSPPSIRARDRPLRVSATQNREYIDDEEEALPFDAVYTENLTRWKEDDICLQYSAANARLPFDIMTDLELELFSDYVIDQLHVNIYLFIRNSTLNMWEMNPTMELALENVFDEMPNAYKSLGYLIVKTFTFLERYGYINHGVFNTIGELLKKKDSTAKSPDKLKASKINIVVIGSGLSGLISAKQLKFFGFNVIVVEARNRSGGRVFTHKTEDGAIFDMGSQYVEGSTGNPVMTLLNQVPVVHKRLKFDCPIYGEEDQLSTKYCHVIEEAFRRLTEATTLLSKENKIREIGGKLLSVQDAFDHFIKLQEAKVATERKEYYTAIDQLADKLEVQSKSLVAAKQVMDNLSVRLQQLLDSDSTPIREDFSTIETENEFKRVCQIKFLRYELSKTIEIFEQLQSERNDVYYTMTTVRKNEPSELYLNGTDRRIMDFYYANLELRLGTMLKNISLSAFATPMTNNFSAHHYSGIND